MLIALAAFVVAFAAIILLIEVRDSVRRRRRARRDDGSGRPR
jgi:hypothetical protein